MHIYLLLQLLFICPFPVICISLPFPTHPELTSRFQVFRLRKSTSKVDRSKRANLGGCCGCPLQSSRHHLRRRKGGRIEHLCSSLAGACYGNLCIYIIKNIYDDVQMQSAHNRERREILCEISPL